MRDKKNNNIDLVIIKKYSNRRLYNSVEKKYITIEEISELIKSGKDIQVIDTQTRKDITKLILIQTILENEKNKEDILPVSFLHNLIKYGNQVAKEYFDNSFIMMLQPHLKIDKNMQNNNINVGSGNDIQSDDIKNIHQRMEELESKIRELSK